MWDIDHVIMLVTYVANACLNNEVQAIVDKMLLLLTIGIVQLMNINEDNSFLLKKKMHPGMHTHHIHCIYTHNMHTPYM